MNCKVSVIVPAYNAEATLPHCLRALLSDADGDTEILVVDDGSTDRTPLIVQELGVTLSKTSRRQSGPAAARNHGSAIATGEILFFVDADVVIRPHSIARVRLAFQEQPRLAALFGSYDDEPAEKNFLSQYKNLLHHFVHQSSDTDAQTFWAGCGAVRKQVFDSFRGFNAEAYSHPSIEDIELGIRLKQKGHSILLDKKLQAKHLKRWSIVTLLKADLLHRAYPWSRLIAEKGEIPNQLNLQISHRISAMVAILFFALLAASILLTDWLPIPGAGLMLLIHLALNRDLYTFFLRKKGFFFTAGAVLWHLSYYVYSAIIFVYCWVRFRFLGSTGIGSKPDHIKIVSHEKR